MKYLTLMLILLFFMTGNFGLAGETRPPFADKEALFEYFKDPALDTLPLQRPGHKPQWILGLSIFLLVQKYHRL